MLTIVICVIFTCAIRVESAVGPAIQQNALSDKTGAPLYLTPLINSGEIEKAQRLSKVKP